MAKAIYFDCPTGISGDMALAALVDLGLPVPALVEGLGGLGLAGWTLAAEEISSYGISGTRLRIEVAEEQQHRHLAQISAMIQAAGLPERARERSLATFERLARAEAAVHGTSVEQVHFHEVGAADSIIDIVGFALGLQLLGVEQLYASALPLGSGWVDSAHGRLPVPAPATLELLCSAGAPTRADDGLRGELVTPTGAALLAGARFERPALRLERVGYGFGRRDLGRANAARAWLGQLADAQGAQPTTSAVLLETNIDDQPGEQLAYVVEQLMAGGALDAWLEPIIMKKGRPAVLLAALVPSELEAQAASLIFRETSSLGLRRRLVERHVCERGIRTVETPLGPIRLKYKRWEGQELGAAPEFEDCARLARQHDLPLRQVYAMALQAAGNAGTQESGPL